MVQKKVSGSKKEKEQIKKDYKCLFELFSKEGKLQEFFSLCEDHLGGDNLTQIKINDFLLAVKSTYGDVIFRAIMNLVSNTASFVDEISKITKCNSKNSDILKRIYAKIGYKIYRNKLVFSAPNKLFNFEVGYNVGPEDAVYSQSTSLVNGKNWICEFRTEDMLNLINEYLGLLSLSQKTLKKLKRKTIVENSDIEKIDKKLKVLADIIKKQKKK